jgi:SAM-dependent methyltransferase
MRRSAVADCLHLLGRFEIDPAVGAAIDVGGTERVYLDTDFAPNPLRGLSPRLTLLDRGFNVDAAGTMTDHEVDFLDPHVSGKLASSFDLTYCFDTLEHVSDPFLFCEHLIQITKPGGHLFVATVFSWPYHPSPEDYFRYSPVGLRECFLGPRNGRAKEIEVLWAGWGSDRRGVALLATRVQPGTTPAPPPEPAELDTNLANRPAGRPLVRRVRDRLATAREYGRVHR